MHLNLKSNTPHTMKRVFICIILILSILLTAKANDIDIIKRNYKQFILLENKSEQKLIELLTATPKETYFSDQMVVELMERYQVQHSEVLSLLSNFTQDNKWSDIDYTDKNRSGWQPKKHVERILLLARAYNTESSDYYQSAEVEETIHKALQFWFETKLVCLNWWYNQIGIPKTMGALLVIHEENLTEEEKSNILQYMENSKFGMTGQNKVWLAGNVLIRALMQNDINLVKKSRDIIFSEIQVGNKEGIKPDNSFHQHGAQQQFGNYGAAYISSMAFWTEMLSGTSLEPDQNQLDIISQLINEGYSRILWKGYMDISSLGRQFFHQAQRHKTFSVGLSASLLMNTDKKNAKPYQNILDENFFSAEKPTSKRGLYHFWMSDYTIQRRPEWMASVKMSSPRVIGAESGNGDNLKGYYLADGATYVYIDGDEYFNIAPIWDWRKIPGITSYETNTPLKELIWGSYRNKSPFVGNSNDGKTGITAIEFDRDGLKASKSWVFTQDFILCLGSGIQADSGLIVTTSIEQSLQKGDLLHLQNDKWEQIISTTFGKTKEHRFFHHKTGYIIFQAEKGYALTENRIGKWKDIMNMYPDSLTQSSNVVSLWIDHGKDPKNGTYQYLILPATTSKEVLQFDTKQINTISNTNQLQAVTIGKTSYIAAYMPANIKLKSTLSFKSSNPGLFMIEERADKIKVIITDPTQLLSSIDITINDTIQTVQLPSADKKGTPIIIYFDYKK